MYLNPGCQNTAPTSTNLGLESAFDILNNTAIDWSTIFILPWQREITRTIIFWYKKTKTFYHSKVTVVAVGIRSRKQKNLSTPIAHDLFYAAVR
jgi:hypothetical protein